MPKIHLEVNELQAGIIQEALDIYSRVIMGQFHEMTKLWENNTEIWRNQKARDDIDKKIEEIRDIVYPELKGYAHWGIYNPKCPETSKIGYDMIQVLRNRLAWHRTPNGGHTVDFGTPLPASKQELIKVDIVE
jgi:hypothetical protein